MMVMEAAVGRVRKSAKKRNKTSGDQTERGGRRGEDWLWSSSSEHGRRGSHAHLSDPQDGTNVVVH